MARREDVATAAQILQARGLTTAEIADELHYSVRYVRDVLHDPNGIKRRRAWIASRTPLQRATSSLEEARTWRT